MGCQFKYNSVSCVLSVCLGIVWLNIHVLKIELGPTVDFWSIIVKINGVLYLSI